MRILIENNAYAPYVSGGAELSVQGVAEALATRNHDVWVLTVGERDDEAELGGVHVVRRRFAGLMSYFDHRASKRTLRKLLNKPLTIDNPANAPIMDAVMAHARPDVVLSNNLMGVTPEFWRSARRADLPIMHTIRDCALMCPNSILVCKARPTCNRPLPHCALMRTHLRAVSGLVDSVCAPSRHVLDLHLSDGYFPRADACVIPNAVLYDADALEESIRVRGEVVQGDDGDVAPLRVCYLGRLVPEKGVLVLLASLCDLWAKGMQVELHMAGRGYLEERLKDYASQGIPLYMHGFLERVEVDKLLMSSDVLVVPSLCAEAFGRVVLDAYAHAMPVIVSDAGALPEVLDKGAGVVVPAGDEAKLSAAIQRYAVHPELIREHGLRGARVLGHYTIKRQVDSFEGELRSLACRS